MALSAAQFDSSVLNYKIIKQTITNATANVDVTSEAGNLIQITCVNGSSDNEQENSSPALLTKATNELLVT